MRRALASQDSAFAFFRNLEHPALTKNRKPAAALRRCIAL